MPRSLATGHRRVTLLTAPLADMKNPTVAELSAGMHISCRLLADGGFGIKIDDSETVSEGSLCDTIIPEIFTTAKASGSLVGFRYFDADGTPEKASDDVEAAIGDGLYQALKKRGAEFTLVTRLTSKMATDDYAAGDPVSVFKVTNDFPREGEMEGYIKFEAPLSVLGFEPDATVKA